MPNGKLEHGCSETVMQISHQINNSLNVLQGVIEFALEDDSINLQCKALLDRGLGQLQDLAYIWLNLVLQAKLQSEAIAPKISTFSGCELVKEITRLSQKSSIPFKVLEELDFSGDKKLLSVALANLHFLVQDPLQVTVIQDSQGITLKTVASGCDCSTLANGLSALLFQVCYGLHELLGGSLTANHTTGKLESILFL